MRERVESAQTRLRRLVDTVTTEDATAGDSCDAFSEQLVLRDLQRCVGFLSPIYTMHFRDQLAEIYYLSRELANVTRSADESRLRHAVRNADALHAAHSFCLSLARSWHVRQSSSEQPTIPTPASIANLPRPAGSLKMRMSSPVEVTVLNVPAVGVSAPNAAAATSSTTAGPAALNGGVSIITGNGRTSATNLTSVTAPVIPPPIAPATSSTGDIAGKPLCTDPAGSTPAPSITAHRSDTSADLAAFDGLCAQLFDATVVTALQEHDGFWERQRATLRQEGDALAAATVTRTVSADLPPALQSLVSVPIATAFVDAHEQLLLGSCRELFALCCKRHVLLPLSRVNGHIRARMSDAHNSEYSAASSGMVGRLDIDDESQLDELPLTASRIPLRCVLPISTNTWAVIINVRLLMLI